MNSPEVRMIDSFGRHIHYLRVSVTDRCDMRCTYCLPQGFHDFEDPDDWLSIDEMARVVGLFVQLGVNKVRLTGGEPLLRKGVSDLAAQIAAMRGLQDLSMSTNASQLSRHAQALQQAGVQRLNISLDSLRPERFAAITKRDVLPDVIAGIDAALAHGLKPIKINTVVQTGVNDDELDDLVEFAIQRGLILRLIEPMPVGHAHLAQAGVNLTVAGAQLAQRWGLDIDPEEGHAGPARYWRSPAHPGMSLGVITPMSQHFCAACNRIRIGVDGTLYPCLGQNDSIPLGQMLRQGASDTELRYAILQVIANKPERHDFNAQPEQVVRFMAQTGG